MPTELLTATEAAALLRLATETVKRKARAGEIPAVKTGRKWAFIRADLEAWLAAGGTRYETTVDRGLAAVAEKRAKDAKWVSEDDVAKKPQR